ncbi:Uncharacterized protein Adt_08814 [Abeliophyllum distichum]|uniref:Uncharacterized protein n=1 Tax=Abeliophyllum distichum TaxID=126358 RepID=A0ABD1UGS8_9LAMI
MHREPRKGEGRQDAVCSHSCIEAQEAEAKTQEKVEREVKQAAASLSTIKKNDPHNSAIPSSSQPSYLQSAGLLSDHVAPYIGPPAGADGMPAPRQAAAPYVSSFADLCGMSLVRRHAWTYPGT